MSQYSYRYRCAGKKLHKVLIQSSSRDNIIVARFMEECLKHAKLRHPNIVQLLGVYFNDATTNVPMLIMEYMPFSLTTCLEKYDDIPMAIKYNILLDVSIGLRFLHEQKEPVLHRDLTANNIMLTASMRAKISDLGQAKIVTIKTAQLTAAPGTSCYMPPEALASNPRYGVEMDIFSFGVLIIHTVVQEYPIPAEPFYNDPNTPGKTIPMSEIERRQSYIESMGDSHPLTALAKKCLENDARLRPELISIIKELSSNAEDVVTSKNSLEAMKAIQESKARIASLESSLHEIEVQLDAISQDIQSRKSLSRPGISMIEKQLKSISSLVHASLKQQGTSEGTRLAMVYRQENQNTPIKLNRSLSTDGKLTSVIQPPINIHFTGAFSKSILYKVVNSPVDVAVSREGLVYVCDKEGWKAVHVYNPNSTEVKSMVDSASSLEIRSPSEKCWRPSGIAVDQSGNVFLSDTEGQRVLKFSAQGQLLAVAGKRYTKSELEGEFNDPIGIAVASNGDIIVCDKGNHRIQVFDSQLNFKRSFGKQGKKTNEFHHPRDVAFDSEGNVYVVDCSNFCVKVFTKDLEPLRQIGSEGNEYHHFRAPMNICIDSNDFVYVTDRYKHCVMVFDPTGVFKMSCAEYGKYTDGLFNHPRGIAVDALGRVYVCDQLNSRVQVFI